MIRRPCRNETEEDLLKLQEEFLKTTKVSNKITPETSEVPKTTKLPLQVVGEVVEKRAGGSIVDEFTERKGGFPSVFQVDAHMEALKGRKRKSIFAMQMEGREKYVSSKADNEQPMGSQLDALRSEIHEENLNKLRLMSEREISEEKKALEQTLDPALLQFLKSRGSKNVPNDTPVKSVEENPHLNIDEVEIRHNLKKTVDEQWMEIDVIEPEKLQWIGDIPDATALEPDKPYSARFDFNGDLQPFTSEVDVRRSLHHHGEEPHRPGYTIQELYQLSRSNVLQQRIIALTTLGNIIRKTKMGYYDSCFDGALLNKLVESDLFFLLRFAMDDRATTTAAVHCLYELFVCRSDEVCLDRLRNMPETEVEPYFFIQVELDKDSEEQDLKDDVIIAQDLVRGVLRTDLLVRFGYILNNFNLDTVTVSKIFDVVTRVARHSVEAGEKILESAGFLDFLFKNLDSPTPAPEAVKLVRVLANHLMLALMLKNLRKNDFKFIFRILDADEPCFKLKLECLHLWSVLLHHRLLLDSFPWFASQLKRLLFFYVSKVDVDHGRFDFELFSGLCKILVTVAKHDGLIDEEFDKNLQNCVQKWATQLVSGRRWNFSVAKALSCALNFFLVKISRRGFTPKENNFIESVSKCISSLISCQAFSDMCDKLFFHSHIIHFEAVQRDPDNLPSLCSVYKNSSDYLKIVQDGCALPFLNSLVELILVASETSEVFEKLCNPLLSSFEKYRTKVLRSIETSNWFTRYEVTFLISLLKLHIHCGHPDSMKFAFRLVPFLRTDDNRVLEIIELVCQSEFSEFAEVCRKYLSKDFRSLYYHSCENFPRHWVYEPISVAPKETLKCLAFILEHCPDLISNVPPTLRYVHVCLVLLNAENLFDSGISPNLEKCFDDVILKFDRLDLDSVTISEKSFYELYRELVNEYASSSYGHPVFAKVVAIPLAQKFNISYRKMMWSEFMHALRVITLPKDVANFIPVSVFTSPVETDESLLILYLNAVTKNVLSETKNGFIYEVAVENVRKFFRLEKKDENLASVLRKRISVLNNEILKKRLMG